MTAALWYPPAKRSLTLPGCGPYLFGPFRGVLHHTEGDSLSGALATYRNTHSYPHFTVDENTVEQHTALNAGTTALEHRAGSIDTNRASAIQIEIVGWTAKAVQMSDELCARLAGLMRWIEAQVGIQNFYTGLNRRFNDNEWRGFNGWCGHVHVPGNSHTDPGAIPLNKLFGQSAPVSTGGNIGNIGQPANSQASADSYSVEAEVAALPVVKQGSSGQHVRILQGLLVANGRNVGVDGAFGPGTTSALKDWQGAVGIGADGVCGPVTWRRLLCI